MTDLETAQFEPNQNPISVVATTNKGKLFRNPIKGKITTQPERINTIVLLCPKRSAINPETSPPIADVKTIPKRIYVFIVSDTPHTCSKKIGKLFDAVRMASLKKKIGENKKPHSRVQEKLFCFLNKLLGV